MNLRPMTGILPHLFDQTLMFYRYIPYSCILFLLFYLNLFCAVQGSPSGGPIDDIPPEVIETFPAHGDTLVPPETTVSITFSETMNRNSVQSALFISPAPTTVPDLSWRGDRIIIDFAELFSPDKTYVFGVGSSVLDLRNNSAVSTYSFAFSTGPSLDEGSISGRVYKPGTVLTNEGEVNAIVWAYKLEDEDIDPDPTVQRGSYVTQTDELGNFLMTNLEEGKYRIFTFTNNDKDFNYFMRSDQIGIPDGDVTVNTTDLVLPVSFFPVTADTIPLQVSLLDSPDRNHISIVFDNSLDVNSLDAEKFQIYEYPGGDRLINGVLGYIYSESTPSNVRIVSDQLIPNREYQVVIDGIVDIYGNTLLDFSDSTTIFVCSILEDDSKFQIEAISPQDSSVNVPIHEKISITFNQPVSSTLIEKHVSISDSLGNQVQVDFIAESSTNFAFRAQDGNWVQAMQYFLEIEADSLYSSDRKFLQNPDTVITFSTMDGSRNGSLIGSVTIQGKTDGFPIIVRVAKSAQSDENQISRILQRPGPFVFSGLIPGEYTITAFIDKNRDKVRSSGKLKPYSPAEPFAVYPEPLTVRSGIDNVGIDITIYTH